VNVGMIEAALAPMRREFDVTDRPKRHRCQPSPRCTTGRCPGLGYNTVKRKLRLPGKAFFLDLASAFLMTRSR
jgi:hypothetical protein